MMHCSNANGIRSPGAPGVVVGDTCQSSATSNGRDALAAASATGFITASPELLASLEMGSRKKRRAPQPPTVVQHVVATPRVGVGDTVMDLGVHQTAPLPNPQSVPQPAPRGNLLTGPATEVQSRIHGSEQTAPRAASRIGHHGTSQVGLDEAPQAAPRTIPHVGFVGESLAGLHAPPRTIDHYDLSTEQHTSTQPGTLVSPQPQGSAAISNTTTSKSIPLRPPPPRLQLKAGHGSDAYDKSIELDSNPEPKARPRSQMNLGATPNQSSSETAQVMDGTNPLLDNMTLTNMGKSKRKAPANPQPIPQSVTTSHGIPLSTFHPSEDSQHSKSPVIEERMEELTSKRSSSAKDAQTGLQLTSNNEPMPKYEDTVRATNASENGVRILSTTKNDEPIGVPINMTRDQFTPMVVSKTSDAVSIHDMMRSTDSGHFERYNEVIDVCNATDEGLIDLDEIAFDETEVTFVNPEPVGLHTDVNGSDIATIGLGSEQRQDVKSQLTDQSLQQTLSVQTILTDVKGDSKPTSSEKNLGMHDTQTDEVYNNHITATPDLPKPPIEKPDLCSSSKQVQSTNCQTSESLQALENSRSELCREKQDLVSLEVQTTDEVIKICSASTLKPDEIQASRKSEKLALLNPKPGTTPVRTQTVDQDVSPENPSSKPVSPIAEIQNEGTFEPSESLSTGFSETIDGNPPVCLDDTNKTAVSLNCDMSKASDLTLLKHATGELETECRTTPLAIQVDIKPKLADNTYENKHTVSYTDVNCNVIGVKHSESFGDSSGQPLTRGKHVEYSHDERNGVEVLPHDDVSRETSGDRTSDATGTLETSGELKSGDGTAPLKKTPPPVPLKSHKSVSKVAAPGGVRATDSNSETVETIESETMKTKHEDHSGIYQYLLRSLSSASSKDSPSVRKPSSNEDKYTATTHDASKRGHDNISPLVLSKSVLPITSQLNPENSLPTDPKSSSGTSTRNFGNEDVETAKKDQPVSSIYQILKKSFPPPTSKGPSPGIAPKDSLVFPHLSKNQESSVSKDEDCSSHSPQNQEQAMTSSDKNRAAAIKERKLPISQSQDNLNQTEKLGIPNKVLNLSDVSNTEEDSLPPPLPQEPPPTLPKETPPPLPQKPPPPLLRSSSPIAYQEGKNETPSEDRFSISESFPYSLPPFRSYHTLNSVPDKLNFSQEKSHTLDSAHITSETLLTPSSPNTYFSFPQAEKTDESVLKQGESSPGGLLRGKKLPPALLPKPYCRPLFCAVGKMKESECVKANLIAKEKMDKVTSPNQELRVINSLPQSLTKNEKRFSKELATSIQKNLYIKDRYHGVDIEQNVFRSAGEEGDYLTGKSNVNNNSRKKEPECQTTVCSGSGLFRLYHTSANEETSEHKECMSSVATCRYSDKEDQAGSEEKQDKATSKTPLGKVDAGQKIITRKREHLPSTEQENVAEEENQRLRKYSRASTEEELHDDEETVLRHITAKQSFTEQGVFEEPRPSAVTQFLTQVKNVEGEEDNHKVASSSRRGTKTGDSQPRVQTRRKINNISTTEDYVQNVEVDQRSERLHQSEIPGQDVDEQDQIPRRIKQRLEEEHIAREDHQQIINNRRSSQNEDVEEEAMRLRVIDQRHTDSEATKQETYMGSRSINYHGPKNDEDFEAENHNPQTINQNQRQNQRADEKEEQTDPRLGRLTKCDTEYRLFVQKDRQDPKGLSQREAGNDGDQKEDPRSIRNIQRSEKQLDAEEQEKLQAQKRIINQRLTHEEDTVEANDQVGKTINQHSTEEECEEYCQASIEIKHHSTEEEYIEEKDKQRPTGIYKRLTQKEVEEENMLKTGRHHRRSKEEDEEKEEEEEARSSKETIRHLQMKKIIHVEKERDGEEDEDDEETQIPRAINNHLALAEEEEAQKAIKTSQHCQEEEEEDDEEEDYQAQEEIDHSTKGKEDEEEDNRRSNVVQYSQQKLLTNKEGAVTKERRGGGKEKELEEEENNYQSQKEIEHSTKGKGDVEEYDRPRSSNQYMKQEQKTEGAKAAERKGGGEKEEGEEAEGREGDEETEVEEGEEVEGEEVEDQRSRRINQHFEEKQFEGNYNPTPDGIGKHSSEKEDAQQEDLKRKGKLNQFSTEEEENFEQKGFQISRINQRHREEEDTVQVDYERPRTSQRSTAKMNVEDDEKDEEEEGKQEEKTEVSIKLKSVDDVSGNHDAPSLSVRSLSSPQKEQQKQQQPHVQLNSSIYQITKNSSGSTKSSAIVEDKHDRQILTGERHLLHDDSNQRTSQFQSQTKKGRHDVGLLHVDENVDLSGGLNSPNKPSPTKSFSDGSLLRLSDKQPVYAKSFQATPSDKRVNSTVEIVTQETEQLTEVPEKASIINKSLKHPAPPTAAKPVKLSPVNTSVEGDDGAEIHLKNSSDVAERPLESLPHASTKQGTKLSKEFEEKKDQKLSSGRDAELYAMVSSKTRVFPAMSQRTDARPAQFTLEEKAPSTAQKRISQKTGPEHFDEEAQSTKNTKGRFLLKSAKTWRTDRLSATKTSDSPSTQEQYSFYFSFPGIQDEGNSQGPIKPEKQSNSVSAEPENTYSGIDVDRGDRSTASSFKSVKNQLPNSQSLNSEPVKRSYETRNRTPTTKDVPFDEMKNRLKQWHAELQQDSALRTKGRTLSAVKYNKSNGEDVFRPDKPVSSSTGRDLQRRHGNIQSEDVFRPDKPVSPSTGRDLQREHGYIQSEDVFRPDKPVSSSTGRDLQREHDNIQSEDVFRPDKPVSSSTGRDLQREHGYIQSEDVSRPDKPVSSSTGRDLQREHGYIQSEDVFRPDKPASSSTSRDLQREHGKIQFHIDLEKSKVKRGFSHGVDMERMSDISTASLPRQPSTYFDMEGRRLTKTVSDAYNYDRPERKEQPGRHPFPQIAKENKNFFFTTEDVPRVKVRYGDDSRSQEASNLRVTTSKSRINNIHVASEAQSPKARTSTMPAEIPNPKPRTSIIVVDRGSTNVAAKPPVVRITSNFRMQSATDLPYVPSSQSLSYRHSSQTANRGSWSTEQDAKRNSLDRSGRARTFYE